MHSQLMTDTFLFDYGESDKIILNNISTDVSAQSNEQLENKYTHEYFKYREVAYAWPSYLDGDEQAIRLSDYKGNVVVFAFGYTNCAESFSQ